MSHSLVIDSDTASDDAVAIVMAARYPGTVIRAVTTVAGNVPVESSTRNALITLDLVGASSVPVFEGAARPLVRPLITAQDVHGEDGMGGAILDPPTRRHHDGHAVDALRDIARREPGQHTLVTLGPLTNIALALHLEPDLLTAFDKVVLMGGAFDLVGNCNEVGEYNIWADPEAAQMVCDAPGNKIFVGWEIARHHSVVTPIHRDALWRAGRLGRFAVEINRTAEEFDRSENGLGGYALADPIAIAVALDPTIATRQSQHAVVVGIGQQDRGGTFTDRAGSTMRNTVIDDADSDAFHAMLLAACSD